MNLPLVSVSWLCQQILAVHKSGHSDASFVEGSFSAPVGIVKSSFIRLATILNPRKFGNNSYYVHM